MVSRRFGADLGFGKKQNVWFPRLQKVVNGIKIGVEPADVCEGNTTCRWWTPKSTPRPEIRMEGYFASGMFYS